jgi:hypothetical protein
MQMFLHTPVCCLRILQWTRVLHCTTQHCALFAAWLFVGFLSSMSASLPAMVHLAQQQLCSSAARAAGWMPLTHLLTSVEQLLLCWHEMVRQGPATLMQAKITVVRTLLPLVQQLQGCGSLLMQTAAAAAACSAPTVDVQPGSSSSSSSSSNQQQLERALFRVQVAASSVLYAIDGQRQMDIVVAAEVPSLQSDPAVAEMQLQLLTAWTAELHKQHTAQQQQQQSPPGSAGASSSSSMQQQQQQQQLAKQQHRADLLSIPAFHEDMLQLLPGGQAYLDAAAEDAAGWGLSREAHAFQLRAYAGICCNTIRRYVYRHLENIPSQQQLSKDAQVVSGAAVKLVLELTLLASGVVQRQREQQRQQQQRQQALAAEDQSMMDGFALQTWDLLGLQIKALAATARSCLPPEVLQHAGLQLLQALAAPLQQWQLSRTGDSFLRIALPCSGDALQGLVTAACGAERLHTLASEAPMGEHAQWFSDVCVRAWLLRKQLCLLIQSPHGCQRKLLSEALLKCTYSQRGARLACCKHSVCFLFTLLLRLFCVQSRHLASCPT